MRCTLCGEEEEVLCGVDARTAQDCGACDGRMRVLVRAIPIVGPTFSKPIVYDQVGKSFDTRAAAKAYTEETGIRPASQSEWRIMRDAAREKADSASQRLGYRDLEHRNACKDAEKAPKQHFIGD